MTTLVSGNLGSATFDASSLCALTGWNITVDQAILESVNHCSSPWTVTARGNKKITGTLTAKVDTDARVESLFFTDALVALELITNSTKKWAGNARMGQITESVNIETGALEEVSVQFTSDGTWTFS